MLSLNDVACRRDGKRLFGDVNCVIHAGQKVGLTGANGTGKSSLFAMIQGTLEPDTGSISLQQHVGITHVAQETQSSERSALDYVVDGDQKLRLIQTAIDQCSDQEGERLAVHLSDLEQAGGYTIQSRAGSLLNGLGFSTEQHQWPVSRFSGGWRMRLNLGQALMSPNELLLLDEPTNHLDLDAVLWLETWLRQREGTLILVSHDREFLDAVTNTTMHIESEAVSLVTGNYSAFERWRSARLSNQQAEHEKAQARRKELQGFVDRFRAKASKARQAQSRLKMLERLGDTQAVRPESPFTFSFQTPDTMPSPLVVLQQANLGYGENTILNKVNLTVQSGDRIGLLGVNGAGKSTLVKALVGSLELQAGSRIPAQKLRIGYFAQHQVDQLRSDQTPLQALLTHDPSLSETQARTFLGTFGFAGDRALQITETLSGGERARLALALIVQSKPNLLLLDEPTNHLDIVMRESLADALVAFEGALLVISHDRTMLRTVVDELWLVAKGSLTPFNDDLDGYARWLAAQRQAVSGDVSTNSGQSAMNGGAAGVESASGLAPMDGMLDRKAQKRLDADRRARLAPLTKAVSLHEKALDKATDRLAKVREKLGADGLYNEERKSELTQLLAEELEARRSVDDIEEKLLESMEALESAS
ncbi:ATP-binding cassette domain-containing protein [Granulosicoccus antarcticus]|nr:ATP-binding cassette domain-containing protein [Granulosicoccus antarcticus]